MNIEKYNKIIQEKFNNNIEISQNMPKDCDYKYSSKEIQEKIKHTNIEKYGSENPNHNRKIREKIEQTNLTKYGFKNPMQNENVVSKVIKTKRENNTFNNID